MSEVTQLLHDIDRGDPQASSALLPLVYSELRKLAASRMAAENVNQTLQATALVHEAYLRLVTPGSPSDWNSRGHFFGAAAECMRRILVENARRKLASRHGGEMTRREITLSDVASGDLRRPVPDDRLLALHDALDRLEQSDAAAADLVKLRYFTGLTLKEAAGVIGVSPRKADLLWAYARAWLRHELDP